MDTHARAGPGGDGSGRASVQRCLRGGGNGRRGRRSRLSHKRVIGGAVHMLLKIEEPKMELIKERQGRGSGVRISGEQGLEPFGGALKDCVRLCSRSACQGYVLSRNGSGGIFIN